MTTRTITTTQLRGMIKEALEESVQEIAVDEKIAALKAKGGRRSLQETKQYRKLLEFKMGGMVDMQALGGPEERKEPFFPSTTEEEAQTIGEREEGNEEEDQKYRVAVEKALDALKQARTFQSKLSQVDTRPEIMDFLTAMTRELMVGANPAVREMGGQALLRLVANNYKEETPSTLDESRRRFLRRR